MKKMQIAGEPMPKFFLRVGLSFFWPWVAGPKYSSAIYYFSISNPYTMFAAGMMDYT